MQSKLNKKTIISVAIASMLIGLGACGGKSDAQTSAAKTDGHADHKHDEAPKMAAKTQSALTIPSGDYTMDMTHGYVTFSYLHKGLSHPQLRFNDVEAHLTLDAEHPENSSVSVTIEAANIDSGVAKFDTHLTSPDFFDIQNNPKITFKSTSFTRGDDKTGTMTGALTMMGITKPVTFNVNLVGIAEGDKPALGVEARTSLNRTDFNLGKYVPFVGDAVSIVVSAEFHKDK